MLHVSILTINFDISSFKTVLTLLFPKSEWSTELDVQINGSVGCSRLQNRRSRVVTGGSWILDPGSWTFCDEYGGDFFEFKFQKVPEKSDTYFFPLCSEVQIKFITTPDLFRIIYSKRTKKFPKGLEFDGISRINVPL